MRIFYAVSIDEKTKQEIRKKTADIGRLIRAGRMIEPFNYHITIEYVGEVEKNKIDHYHDILKDAVKEASSSDIVFSKISSFIRNKAHLIFLQAERQKEVEGIRERIASLIPGERRPFLPHITICRDAIFEKGFDINEIADKIGYEPIIVKADNISLMESSLINGKLVYITLFNMRL